MQYVHKHLDPEADGSQLTRTARFSFAQVSEGHQTWHATADDAYNLDDPAVDISFKGEGGAALFLELTPGQAVNLTVQLLRHVVAETSTELVDLAAEVLQNHGWFLSGDGALNPPEPEPEPQPWGFTVQVSAVTAEEAERALLRRLKDAGDRDRFRVEVAGEEVWSGK